MKSHEYIKSEGHRKRNEENIFSSTHEFIQKKKHIKVNIKISFFRFTRLTTRNMSKCHIIFVVCLKHFLCLKKNSHIKFTNTRRHNTTLFFFSPFSFFITSSYRRGEEGKFFFPKNIMDVIEILLFLGLNEQSLFF